MADNEQGRGLFTRSAKIWDDVLSFKPGLEFPIQLEAFRSRNPEKRIAHTDEELKTAFEELAGLSPYGVVDLWKRT